MGKRELLLLSTILFVMLSSILVSAQYYPGYSSGYGPSYFFGNGLNWFQYYVGPYFDFVLGGTGSFLFERILLFLVLFSFIYIILIRIPVFKDNLASTIIVSLAVSLLSTRFFGDFNMLMNALAPYSVLGVALTAGIPLVIYFFFVQSFETSSSLRKILWIFFIIVFMVMWQARSQELGQAAYIYLLTGIVALLFLLFDGTIRRILNREKMKFLDAETAEEAARKIRNLLYDLHQDYNTKHSIGKDYYEREKRRLEKELKSIHKL